MESSRPTLCMNIPDLSLTTAVVEYGAGHIIYAGWLGCNPSDVGWNQDFRTTISYSAVSGSTTEVELRVTTTAAILSDWTTPSTTCTFLGESFTTIWADEAEIYEQRLLNQMSAICRASRSQDVLYMSCRSGFGGSGRRRNALWSNCPKTAPASSRTATSETGCITATIYALQNSTCTKPAASNDKTGIQQWQIAVIAVIAAVIAGCVLCCCCCKACPLYQHMHPDKDQGVQQPQLVMQGQTPGMQGQCV